ncbi:hypothetical protein [Empedobacter tilapiae]|uniref:hypothetical protein n=1 Tax=Empedobacter tilapiae TaxID=2491114 RepID=UPI0028D42BF0|nr:hypothetical protein [Empedobacter tilapiae]
MKSILGNKESFISYSVAFLFILIMIGAAIIYSDKEIILPEVAALSVGILTFRENKWLQQPFHIFLLPSITAILGFGINFLPILLSFKLALVLIAILIVLKIFKSQLAPALATGLLPILTNAESFIFLYAIFLFVFLLFLSIKIFKLKPTENAVPMIYTSHNRWLIGLCIVWFVACYFSGFTHFSAIPPIIVISFESLNNPTLKLTVRLKRILVMFMATMTGCLTMHYLDNWLIIGLIDLIIVMFVLKLTDLRLPPAFAMVILPMILPSDSIKYLPVATLIMSIFFMLSIYIIQKIAYPKAIDFK